MKNHKEMFEALLAGETLTNATNGKDIKLIDGILHSTRYDSKEFVQLKNVLGGMFESEVFEIKRKTININGFEVPEPLREIPELGKAGAEGSVYVVSLSEGLTCQMLITTSYLRTFLELGLCHKTKEAAELHTKALISFTQKE